MKQSNIRRLSINQFMSSFGVDAQAEDLNVFMQTATLEKLSEFQPVRVDHFSFLMILGGECHVKLDLIEYILKKNDLLVIAPNTVRQIISMDKNFQIIAVSFIPDFLFGLGIHKNYVNSFDFFSAHSTEGISLTDEDATSIVGLLNLLYKKNQVKAVHPFGKEIVTHAFSLLLFEMAALYKKYGGDIKAQFSRKEELAVRFVKLLPLHYTKQRSVQFYAGLLNVTPNYLTRTVKETLSKTAGEMIDEMVVLEAKILLQQPLLSISEVAARLYFSDQFLFSRFFKKQTGTSPSAYRKV